MLAVRYSVSFDCPSRVGRCLRSRTEAPWSSWFWAFPNPQLLSAATLTRKLKGRSQLPANIFRNETTFDYVQSPNDASGDNLFVATLTVKSRRPILVLEEIEDFLEDIVCHDAKMTIRFLSAETLNAFKVRLKQLLALRLWHPTAVAIPTGKGSHIS